MNLSLYPFRHHSWVPKTRRYSQCKGNWFTPPHAWVSLWASLLLETFPSVTAAMSLFAFDRTDVEVMVNQIIFEEPLVSKHRKPQLRRLIYSTCFVVSSHAFFYWCDGTLHHRVCLFWWHCSWIDHCNTHNLSLRPKLLFARVYFIELIEKQEALCASTAKSHLLMTFAVRRRRLGADFHAFWKLPKSIEDHLRSLQGIFNDP